MSRVRPFPVRVHAFASESPASFFRRLCEANGVDEHDAWLVLRHQDPNLLYKITPLGARYVAGLGGLPEGYFDEVVGRSGGRGKRLLAFPVGAVRGEPLPVAALCRRCSHGEAVAVQAWVGPICLRHRRWVQPDRGFALDDHHDTRRLPRHNSAQRCLNGTLRARGIGYSSLAVAAAREALRRVKGEQLPRSKDGGIPLETEVAEFPDVVRLTAHLTSAGMARILLNDELESAARAIAIAYVTHALLIGHDVIEAIARIRIVGREISLSHDIPAIGPYTRVDDLPDFAKAITGSNSNISARLLRFLQTPERGRKLGAEGRSSLDGVAVPAVSGR